MTNQRARLLIASALLLFVELALIRWSGEQVVHLSFFSNVILLASFLGIGIGFLAEEQRGRLMVAAPWLLSGYVLLLTAVPVTIDRSGSDLIYFSTFGTTGPPPWVAIPVVFVLSAAVMAGLGAHVAVVFERFEPLTAYRLDIGGSILGIIGFGLVSWIGAPPVVWGGVAALGFWLLVGRSQRLLVAPLLVLVALLGVDSVGATWSPYYRIDTRPLADSGPGALRIDVNGIPHQEIVTTDVRLGREPQYEAPYGYTAKDDLDVLVIGAGTGADVAVALRNGASSVDAVEIDPALLELGRQLHPDRPYDDPRVVTHTTDGRAFLEQTDETWDLILFALPDSLTLLQGQSALRLESYLFTVEAVEAARERLRPDGVLAMYNYYREEWLVERYQNTMHQVFDQNVCVDLVGEGQGLSVLVVGRGADLCRDGGDAVAATGVEPVRDDRPFPYLRTRTLPESHLLLIAAVIALAAAAVRMSGVQLRRMVPYSDLFLMGVAFLLLETRAVVQFALLFGTTWSVNAMVFGGVLIAVLAAIEVAERLPSAGWRPSRRLMYGLLVVALGVAAAFPLDTLLGLPTLARLVAGIAVAFTPVFLANVLFADRFRDTASSTTAFGANLLGAVVGGLLEYASTLVGFRALGLLAAIVYLSALAVERRVDQRVGAA